MLRSVEAADLDVFFEQQRDREANRMAAFTAEDPDDRAAFMAKWERILVSDTVVVRTAVVDRQVAGSVLLWRDDTLDAPEVSYWIGREFWGRGIATEAVAAFLAELAQRPLYGRAAADNLASQRVLEKCGFKHVGRDSGFANARGKVIDEVILRLEG